MATDRAASHSGTWYASNAGLLQQSLGAWLAAAGLSSLGSQCSLGGADSTLGGTGLASTGPDTTTGLTDTPTRLTDELPTTRQGRVIIAPHAGFAYSGPTAAHAYARLHWSSHTRRVFILGPAHHLRLAACALSQCQHYASPLGLLPLDQVVIRDLTATALFAPLALPDDLAEHSIEMHLPFVAFLAAAHALRPTIVPILVGALSPAQEARYAAVLQPYLADPANLFVVSSDFCHWGPRFSYFAYRPAPDAPLLSLAPSLLPPPSRPIHESIADIDHHAMRIIESGSHNDFTAYLKSTNNTICGRHPIAIILAALQLVNVQVPFTFVHYAQSEKVAHPTASSVSYAAAFAVPN